MARSVQLRWMVPLLALTGCLSFPPPADGNGNGTPEPFPRAATNLREPYVADFNDDGRDDLLLTNDTGDRTTQGFYILLGRTDRFGDESDSYVVTDAVPHAAHIADLVGSDALDVFILGPDDTRVLLLGFEATGATTFAVPYGKELTLFDLGDLVPETPSFVSSGQFDGDDIPHLVAGGQLNAVVGEITDWSSSGFAGMQMTNLIGPEPNQAFGDSFTAIARAGNDPPAPDDLLVIGDFRVSWYQNDGAGNFGNDITRRDVATPGMRHAVYVDVDEDGCPDVLGGHATNLFAVTLSCDVAGAMTDYEALPLSPITDTGVTMAHLAAADFDGNGRPDLIVLDNAEDLVGPQSSIEVHENFYLSGSMVVTDTSKLIYRFTDFHPDFIALGDFDGDDATEIYVFDRDGTFRCLEVIPGDSLQPCP